MDEVRGCLSHALQGPLRGPSAAVLLDGATYLDVPTWTPGGTSWDVEIEFMVEALGANKQVLLSCTTDPNWELYIEGTSDKIAFTYDDQGSVTRTLITAGAVPLNTWLRVNVQARAGGVTMHALTETRSNTSNLPESAPPWDTLGSDSTRAAEFFTGQIKDVFFGRDRYYPMNEGFGSIVRNVTT